MCQGPRGRKQSTIAAENHSEFWIVRMQLLARRLLAKGNVCLGVWINHDLVTVTLEPVNHARNDFFQLWLVGFGDDGGSGHSDRDSFR